MCGRLSLFVPVDVVEERFEAAFREPWTPRYNLAPRDDVAVVTNQEPAVIEQHEWGLVPPWVDDIDDFPTLINARAESLDERASFRDAFRERRCLVLADGFYEWAGERGRRQPYRIARTDGEPFAFAGLWETWGSNGETRQTATIVTTTANDAVSSIHDRMPVILDPGHEATWLHADDPDDRRALLHPYESAETDVYPVSVKVNDPANDSPAVLEPAAANEQTGLGDF